MNILDELGKLVEDDSDDFEEVRPMKRIASKISSDNEGGEDSSGSIDEMLQHIKAVQDAAKFVDKFTTDQGNTSAFEAEISLRKAIQKMQDLTDEVYKKNNKEKKDIKI